MSERFIFNKKLQPKRRRWYVLALVVLGVLLANVLAQPARAQSEEPLLLNPKAMQAQPYVNTLVNIDFTRNAIGDGVITLDFENTASKPQLIESQGEISLTFLGTALADSQLVEIDVTEFATPINEIESFIDERSVRIEARYTGQVRIETEAKERQVIVTVKPLTPEQVAAGKTEKEYEGKPISLDFQDVPVRQVLQIIAQVNGFNLVTTDTVSGNVTIKLSNIPWDQALDMILKIKGLDKRTEGNILLIAPAEELAAREAADLQSLQKVVDLSPLRTVSIPINYAKAADMAAILNAQQAGMMGGAGQGMQQGRILTERGSVTIDERTNTILVRDIQSSIDEARELIALLDVPVKQVLIESRMVTVRDNVGDELGVRWGFSDRQDDNGVSGTLEGADIIAGGVVPALAQRLNVNLPVANPAGRIGFQVASLVDGTILDLELSALESENKGEIIASPRITVANQQEAYIEQGTEIPFVLATSSGATAVEFKKAVLSLRVTPQITPDNRIILDLIVTQDSRGETVPTPTGPAVAIDTQQIHTQVLVNNGETVVLGGIFQQIVTDDTAKVPLLGDLPGVGALFRSNSKLSQKRELLIFVTPKIITQ